MQKSPEAKAKQPEINDQVKLTPILGIRPGIYLSVLYSVILLIVLFFLLLMPGLRKTGTMLLINTEPAGAAVRIDDVYWGVSGRYLFVPKGLHTVETVLPGFQPESVKLEIKGRVFGSLFFPLRKKIEFTLKTNDPARAFTGAAEEFAEWSFGGEPTPVWQVPLVLSEGAYRIGQYNPPQGNEILAAASRFAVTKSALRDLTRAKILLDNGGSSPSPAGLLGSVSEILIFLSENPGSAQWLADLLPEAASLIKTSGWYQSEYAEKTTTINSSEPAGRFILNDVNFIYVPSGVITFRTVKNNKIPPRSISINRFMISETPVSGSLFETFLNENPKWKNDFTDYYEEEISIFPSEIHERQTITGITWYAAEAFCGWLTERLPPSMADMEVRLPAEIEWEYAAEKGIPNMENPDWEWCADPFAPLQFIGTFTDNPRIINSPERVLRRSPASTAPDRASLQPELSSPFVTFRLVIAEKDNSR